MTSLPDLWRLSLPDGWEWVKLNRVASLGTGHTPDRNRPDYWTDCTVPWVTAADLSGRRSAFDPLMDTEQKVSHLGLANSAAVEHPTGTVMFCRTASVGLFCITGRPMATTQAFVTWTPGPQLVPRYLLYVIAAMRPEFDRLAYGSTHLTIYMPDLEALRIPLPPLNMQSRIADFLDEQIRRLTLGQEARSSQAALAVELDEVLFQELLEERGLRFPSRLDDRFESIPVGWSVRTLGQVCRQFTNGYVGPTRDILVEDGIPYIQSIHIKDGGIDFDRKHFFVTPEWHSARPRINLQAGDVLIVQTGDIGQVAVVPEGFGEASCHALQIARTHRHLTSGPYLGAYLRTPFARECMLSRATGALHPHLEAGVKSTPVVVPPLNVQSEVLHAYERLAGSVKSVKALIASSIQLLEERKRSLITAAVTGEFDVTSASSRASDVALSGVGGSL